MTMVSLELHWIPVFLLELHFYSCYDLAKWLSHYFILLPFFFFLFELTTQERSIKKYYMTMLYITRLCHINDVI